MQHAPAVLSGGRGDQGLDRIQKGRLERPPVGKERLVSMPLQVDHFEFFRNHLLGVLAVSLPRIIFEQNHPVMIDLESADDRRGHMTDTGPYGDFFHGRRPVTGQIGNDCDDGFELRHGGTLVFGEIEDSQATPSGGQVEFTTITLPVENIVKNFHRRSFC
ncbi:hypothetical protein DESC_770141 [Desulfosarcina cetonica]|nr:hypothetical protein DESC_770141 [Desulfosarcina cetonica]